MPGRGEPEETRRRSVGVIAESRRGSSHVSAARRLPNPAPAQLVPSVDVTIERGDPGDRDLAESLPDLEFTVLELADRLLNRGVVLVGEATISVAGVDLIYLGLNVVLTAVENLVDRSARPDGA